MWYAITAALANEIPGIAEQRVVRDPEFPHVYWMYAAYVDERDEQLRWTTDRDDFYDHRMDEWQNTDIEYGKHGNVWEKLSLSRVALWLELKTRPLVQNVDYDQPEWLAECEGSPDVHEVRVEKVGQFYLQLD